VPAFGEHGGTLFLRAFEIKRYIKRYVKMPCKWVSLSVGALLGELEWIHLLGHFERNGKYVVYLGFSWTQRTLRF
jgi:hypothetical protein